LLQTEVGDEAGTVGRWARRAGRPCGLGGAVGLGWPAGQGRKVAGPIEEGRGHEEVRPEGRARLAGLNGPKGRKYLGQISSGLWSNEI
jgi:hypothetical protein